MSGDTWHSELLFPTFPSSSPSLSHQRNEYLIRRLDFLPGVPMPLSSACRCRIIVDYDGGLRIRDRDRNGGSCIVLASDSGGGPRLRWQLMVDPVSCWHLIVVVDHDWWWILMTAVDHDCGLQWPILMVDPDRGGCWPWTMITSRLLDI